jgi:hypothetical protein
MSAVRFPRHRGGVGTGGAAGLVHGLDGPMLDSTVVIL